MQTPPLMACTLPSLPDAASSSAGWMALSVLTPAGGSADARHAAGCGGAGLVPSAPASAPAGFGGGGGAGGDCAALLPPAAAASAAGGSAAGASPGLAEPLPAGLGGGTGGGRGPVAGLLGCACVKGSPCCCCCSTLLCAAGACAGCGPSVPGCCTLPPPLQTLEPIPPVALTGCGCTPSAATPTACAAASRDADCSWSRPCCCTADSSLAGSRGAGCAGACCGAGC